MAGYKGRIEPTCLGGNLGVLPEEELDVHAWVAWVGGGGGVDVGAGLALRGRRGGGASDLEEALWGIYDRRSSTPRWETLFRSNSVVD